MRWTTWRLSASTAALAAIVVLTGCDSKSKGTSGTAGAGTATGSSAIATGPTGRQAADQFLAALTGGTATPDQLTDRFRQKIARPAKGDEVQDWLSRFKGTNFVIGGEPVTFGNAVVLRGRAEAPNRRESFTLRMIQDGSTYKADWLHRSERIGTEIKNPSDPELSAAQDVVRNFLDVLLGGDLRQAHALMTPAWRAKIAPPTPADTREGYDYSPGFLTQTTRAWKRDFTGYSLTRADLAPGRTLAAFVAEFHAGGQMVPYSVKTIKIPETGEWLVLDFSKQ